MWGEVVYKIKFFFLNVYIVFNLSKCNRVIVVFGNLIGKDNTIKGNSKGKKFNSHLTFTFFSVL